MAETDTQDDHALSVMAQRLWNSFPLNIMSDHTIKTLKTCLKALFSLLVTFRATQSLFPVTNNLK